MGFFRNVGKMTGAIYGVGKKAIQFKRLVGKATGGASDKLINYGVNALETQLREKLPQYDQMKQAFNTSREMVNDASAGNYENALRKGHNFAKQHSNKYNNFSNQVNQGLDKYNLRKPAYQMYNNKVRPYMRNGYG
jgi:hypothetical protein